MTHPRFTRRFSILLGKMSQSYAQSNNSGSLFLNSPQNDDPAWDECLSEWTNHTLYDNYNKGSKPSRGASDSDDCNVPSGGSATPR